MNIGNKEITFYFIIPILGEYKIKARLNDIFQSVLDKFIKNNNIPNFNKNIYAVYSASTIKKNKTILENKIIENSRIMLYNIDEDNPTPEPEPKIEPPLNKKEDEYLDLDTLLNLIDDLNDIKLSQDAIYESIRINNSSKINENKEGLSLFHNHTLILLYSNCQWICNNCKKHNSEEEPKYYCSLCDYNICIKCVGDEKKYFLQKFCHEQKNLKIFKFPFHEHKLIYCRTSRSEDKETFWTCDICNKTYGNKIWSFYCTYCDYDLCLKCSKKYISIDDLVTNYGIKTDNHEHVLVFMITNRSWNCQLCKKSYESIEPTYYCTNCKYNICMNCMESISDEEKYPFFSDGERIDYDITEAKIGGHQHNMMYCITSRQRIPTSWNCNLCLNNHGTEDWSFYCSLCDFDICYSCYLDSLK